MANLFPPRQQSLAASAQIAPSPGSFNTDLRSVISRAETARSEYIGASYDEENAQAVSKKRQAELRNEIDKESKIKVGTENMLEALNSKKVSKEQRFKVEAEHNASKRRIDELHQKLNAEIRHGFELQQVNEGRRMSYLTRTQSGRPPSGSTILQVVGREQEEEEEEEDSPTFVLSELLQALEEDSMGPEYYINIANRLVDLLKRHPTLKYDLAWSIFGLRIQTMLLSDSREVVAAGYRVVRYAITDRRSLKTIRDLHTDNLVILSLVKDSKASVEREQALKFARAFLDVTDGVKELSIGVIRTIVAVAEHNDDRLRNIATLTLAEIMIKDPARLVEAGGMGVLSAALGDPTYRAGQSLTTAFLYLLDVPSRRRFFRSGHELEAPIAVFTESPVGHTGEDKLKANAKVVTALLRSWPGLLTLSSSNFLAIRSLVASIHIPLAHVRNALLDLVIDILRIKSPSWSSSFLAGRRLTTYARVTNLKAAIPTNIDPEAESETNRDLVEHFVAVVLAVFVHSGLVDALLFAETEPLNVVLKRKTTLVLGEVLKLSGELLPTDWSAKLQVLPDLIKSAAKFESQQMFADDRFIALGTIYQVDSVNRTLYRSETNQTSDLGKPAANDADTARQAEHSKAQQGMLMDEAAFRTMMIDSGVPASAKYNKWRWDIVQNIIDGPLINPKRLDEAAKSTKFLKHLLGFYRPFKWRFCEVKNTRPNQRYVRVGCALMTTLLKTPEGERELREGKLIRQLAECLSHYDRMSGLLSEQPLFTEERLNETLTGGYFQILGALTKDIKGLQILERWRIPNMFYHIIELQDRDDLIRLLLSGTDYTLDSHLRIILSKAMTSCSKDIRIFATKLLRKYATKPFYEKDDSTVSSVVEWAIRLLLTQLYDPEIEVGDVAIKILQEACVQQHSLEYIVRCRPALDHLGPIGAPLLLRFLSTSVGYKYLEELDYITREMDDWFLGRNDDYVSQIEASLARALADVPDQKSANQPASFVYDDASNERVEEFGVVPPHFYRELTRTKEGAALLAEKGHFYDFAELIRDHAMGPGDEPDPETVLKIKGCLWAVGNVGSMALGAPFLEESGVVGDVVTIAEKSCIFSVRGTAFFALGLISRSLHGQEILLQYGWDGTTNIRGEGLGYIIPIDITQLFTTRPWRLDAAASPAILTNIAARKPLVNREARANSGASRRKESLLSQVQSQADEDDPVTSRIIKLVTDLGNTVLAKKAASELTALRARKTPHFANPDLFQRVMAILASHRYSLTVCRFILDLFEKKIMRQIVLEEEDVNEDTIYDEEISEFPQLEPHRSGSGSDVADPTERKPSTVRMIPSRKNTQESSDGDEFERPGSRGAIASKLPTMLAGAGRRPMIREVRQEHPLKTEQTAGSPEEDDESDEDESDEDDEDDDDDE